MRRAREGVVRAWNRYKAAEARTAALREAVRAAETALDAVRVEVEFEQRLVVDELDAARDLVNNQVALERAEHDHVLAGYELSFQVGRLTSVAMGVPDLMPRRPGALEWRNFVPTPWQFIEHRDAYFGGQETQ